MDSDSGCFMSVALFVICLFLGGLQMTLSTISTELQQIQQELAHK